MIIVTVKIQSLSDIITNSSSELFAVIESPKLNEIEEYLRELFPNQEEEVTLCILHIKNPHGKFSDDEEWSWRYNGDEPGLPGEWLELTLPYSECKTFYESGIRAVLEQMFGNNFEIQFV